MTTGLETTQERLDKEADTDTAEVCRCGHEWPYHLGPLRWCFKTYPGRLCKCKEYVKDVAPAIT